MLHDQDIPSDADTLAKLPPLYDEATHLEDRLSRHESDRTMDAAHIQLFNDILERARQLLPKSVALSADMENADETTRPMDARHDINDILLPTLRNALPKDKYTHIG